MSEALRNNKFSVDNYFVVIVLHNKYGYYNISYNHTLKDTQRLCQKLLMRNWAQKYSLIKI